MGAGGQDGQAEMEYAPEQGAAEEAAAFRGEFLQQVAVEAVRLGRVRAA